MTSRFPPSALSRAHLQTLGVTLLCIVGSCLLGCVTRQSTDLLRKQVATLEQENFQLRKELAEAKVRLEMQRGVPQETSAPAGPARSSTSRPAADTAPAPSKDDASRVIYSEPITDASKFTTGVAATSSSPPARLMRSARERLDAKDPASALSLFRQLVAQYPGDALADDAQFGVGECYFQMGKYEEAITEYRKVVTDFPFGDQVPFAFLKIGFAHLAREQRDLALDNFKTVSEAYPGTEAATVARQQIAHLKAAGR